MIASDPFVSAKQGQQVGVTLHSKEEVLQRADFVTLHATLTEKRAGRASCLAARELCLLKPGAYLVNCARGSLIDEQALLLRSLKDDWQEWRSMSSARNLSVTIQCCGNCSRMNG